MPPININPANNDSPAKNFVKEVGGFKEIVRGSRKNTSRFHCNSSKVEAMILVTSL
jgi:hypothetical protein